MSSEAVLQALRAGGVRLWVEGERLRFSAPAGQLGPELKRQLAEHRGALIARLRAAQGGAQARPALARDPARARVASFAQQRLWYVQQLDPASTAYNVPGALLLRGAPDAAALEAAFGELVRRHEVLRTTFRESDGALVLGLEPAAGVRLERADLRALAPEPREHEIRRQTQALEAHAFDLGRGPLLRARLLRTGECEHVLLFAIHHIAYDGWSEAVLVRELSALYRARVEGRPAPLTELAVQYSDYAYWQREWLQGEVLSAALRHWTEQAAGLPESSVFAPDFARPARAGRPAELVSFALDAGVGAGLRALAQREGATLFMVLLAVFMALLARYTGQRVLAVGCPIANRGDAALEGLIGCFVNTLLLRADLDGASSFLTLLRQVRERALEAYRHQDLPFERLVAELVPGRDASRPPLFQILFMLQNFAQPVLELPGLQVEPFAGAGYRAKVDLTVSFAERGGQLQAGFLYDTERYERASIERIAGHFERLAAAAAAAPAAALARLPLLAAGEREQLVRHWGRGEPLPRSAPVLHAAFERWARATPGACAVRCEQSALSFRELDRRANALAHALHAQGVVPDERVGLCARRGAEMIVAMLGILKAGAAYVPLDPALPDERLERIVRDCGSRVVVAPAGVDRAWPAGVRIARVELSADPAAQAERAPAVQARPESLAYVLYTSGSTGTPKGVCVEHRHIVSYLDAVQRRLELGRSRSFAWVSTFAADLGHTVLFAALCGGGCLHVISEARLADPEAFADYCEAHPIDALKIVPSHLRALLRGSRPLAVLPRRQLVLGGELLRWSFAEELQRLRPQLQIANHYGPTETTVGVLTQGVGADDGRSRSVPIGRPLPNVQAYVVDRDFELVPPGVTGELVIGGASVTRGYLGAPALSAQRYVPDPFGAQPGGRLYRTGDLVRQRPDGALEFLGRRDHQVKIRGFRVELAEVEAALLRHEAVCEAALLVRAEQADDASLVAYLVLCEPRPSDAELRRFLRRALPAPMIPAAFVPLERLPLTENGKLDRRALAQLAPAAAARAPLRSEPADALEARLLEIWADVLGAPLERTDDFFEAGGHSLLSVELLARVRRELGAELSLAALLEASTVEGMAHCIREGRGAAQSTLLRLRAGAGLPFFAVHPIGGSSLCYAELARALDGDSAFFALQAPALEREQAPYPSVEAMAAAYLAEIRVLWPAGPYCLGGWSFGGVVAYEMARQALRAGAQVGALVLLDAWAPQFGEAQSAELSDRALGAALLADLAGLRGLELDWSAAAGAAGADPDAAGLEGLLAAARSLGVLPAGLDSAALLRRLAVFRSHWACARSYRPQPYPGRAVLLRAERAVEPHGADAERGWGALIGALEVHSVAADHYALLRPPHVGQVAKELGAALARAAQRRAGS